MAEQELGFSSETVPDRDSVFRLAHKNLMVNGLPGPGVFKADGGGMSVDWCKYARPEQTKAHARKPHENAVLEMNVGSIRSIPPLDVFHTPEPQNPAHCDVPLPEVEEDLTEVRLKLRRITKIVIPLDLPA